jgi:hypothetical protein
MNNFIAGLFVSKLNKFIVIGFILLILGFLLTPILIGIPILMIGSFLFVIGVMMSFANLLPGGNTIVSSYKNMFSQMWEFLKALIKA